MDLLKELFDFILHIDRHLIDLCAQYGMWVYGILFLIVFCETGFVVTPFLPGDSLLFAVGSLAAIQALRLDAAIPLLIAAALTGDNVNYWVGRYLGPRVFSAESRFLNKVYLDRTRHFYERHGRKTVVIARFLPIIRTFAPFVAGVGSMLYPRFLTFSILGATLWVALFVLAGYFFGNIPVVKQNFTLVILTIIVVSVLPSIIEVVRMKLRKKTT
jgi:membrane-associated protein